MAQQYPATVTPWGSQFAMAARSITNVKVRGADGGDVSCRTSRPIGFGDLEVACWPLVPKFVRSNPAEAVGFFRAKKSSAHLPSEGK
jgi:hypothetical protein